MRKTETNKTTAPERIWAWKINWIGRLNGMRCWTPFVPNFSNSTKIEIVKGSRNPFNKLFWFPECKVPDQIVTEYVKAELYDELLASAEASLKEATILAKELYHQWQDECWTGVPPGCNCEVVGFFRPYYNKKLSYVGELADKLQALQHSLEAKGKEE